MKRAHVAAVAAILAVALSAVWYTQKQDAVDETVANAPADVGAGISSENEQLQKQMVKIRIGQEVAILDETLRIERIVEDSRCPIDVQCIWAGTVRLDARMGTGMGDSQMPLSLGETSSTEINTYTLVSVEPASRSGGEISSSDYVFTIEAARR